MRKVLIPFGTFGVEGGTLEGARQNIDHLIKDANLDPDKITVRYHGYNSGYYEYTLHRWLRTCDVSMVGFPIEQARQFPTRLHVDGGGWLWDFAPGILHVALTGKELQRGSNDDPARQ